MINESLHLSNILGKDFLGYGGEGRVWVVGCDKWTSMDDSGR
jgi:hypothetical protein